MHLTQNDPPPGHPTLQVKNPLVSSSQMETRLSGISIVRLGQLRSRHQGPGLGAAWCTLAVLGECSPPRVSASGNAYSIWKLADLDQACVSLFLFGRAHEELRREPPGRLVAVFNAKVRADGGEFSLSADSAEQLLLLGTASEFGYCKATKKVRKKPHYLSTKLLLALNVQPTGLCVGGR